MEKGVSRLPSTYYLILSLLILILLLELTNLPVKVQRGFLVEIKIRQRTYLDYHESDTPYGSIDVENELVETSAWFKGGYAILSRDLILETTPHNDFYLLVTAEQAKVLRDDMTDLQGLLNVREIQSRYPLGYELLWLLTESYLGLGNLHGP